VHSIAAPPFLCSAGAFHRRDMLYSFGRRISSPRRILFVRPAHLIAAPQSLRCNLFVCRRIRRRSTDLVLVHLAGAFPAEPPPI
jgi:hypothetical protein